MGKTESRCCICRVRAGGTCCDNCNRLLCALHERRNERTGAPLCWLCHHWLDLPIGEVLHASSEIVAAPTGRWSPSLNCPDCSVAMARGFVGRVSVDCCPSCGGFWFDRTQLSLMISQHELYPSWQSLPVRMFPLSKPLDTGSCPGCGTQTLAVGTWSERRIEQCRRCMGLWLSPKPVDTVSRLIDLERRTRARAQPDGRGDVSAALRTAKHIAEYAEGWS